jgi:hypothetical protein
MSPLPLLATVRADVAVVRIWAMCGRLQVGKENLHVAGLVGAAMLGWTAPLPQLAA